MAGSRRSSPKPPLAQVSPMDQDGDDEDEDEDCDEEGGEEECACSRDV